MGSVTITGSISTSTSSSSMSPRPNDDLFIEPAGDYDVVYGDDNATMEASSSAHRPYVRLTSFLRNITKSAGDDVRFRCEAVGSPMPLSFSWLKNHAPVERNRKIRIRDKEHWSRLVISELDVLDSGYYSCIVSNAAASVNSTGVLRVNNVPIGKSTKHNHKLNKPSRIHQDLEDDEQIEEEENRFFEDSQMPGGLGRLPEDEEADESWRSAAKAAGPGFVPLSSDRWLDGITLKKDTCIEYRGDACREHLIGNSVLVTSESREDMLDIDRNLRAAMMFIQGSRDISIECKRYSHAVACFHMYKVCDTRQRQPQPQSSIKTLAICRRDCDRLQTETCPREMALAAEHELIGDGPKALLPKCESLSQVDPGCIPVLDTPIKSITTPVNEITTRIRENQLHWCFVDSGKSYEGSVETTKSGKRCLPWTQSTSLEFNVERYPALRNSRNFCRNPGGKKTSPWCYSSPHGQEDYCDVVQCPENMYPHLKDTPSPSPDNTGGLNVLNEASEMWHSLSSQTQLALLSGIGGLSLLLLLVCCLCCCRRKGKSSSNSSSVKKNNGGISCNGSTVNSAANSAFYRKLNGTASTPIPGSQAGFELASLLPTNHHPTSYNSSQYSPRPPNEPFHIPEISPNQLQIDERLGEGQFSVIHRANWHGIGSSSSDVLQVAVKKLRPMASNQDRQNFEMEIRTVAMFHHPNVTQLIGVCYLDQQIHAVWEYMVHGDLHELLLLRAPKQHGYDSNVDKDRLHSDNEDFIRIASQIAAGMEYLASMNYIHKDLATRTCLVGDQRVIKVSDFGLVRACYEKDYYKMMHRTWMPLRWMSKEALQQGKFGQFSDVWAFGVTLWEIFSYGRQPYERFENLEVIEQIAMRNLLDCPVNCPTNVYSLMVECWHENADRRPTFTELFNRLQTWTVLSPAASMQNRASSTHSGSSGANRGSRQSSSNQSGGSLLRATGIGPTPLQTLINLNGVHPYHQHQQQHQHQHQHGLGRSPKPRSTQPIQGDASPLMRGTNRGAYTYSESGEEDDSE